MSTEYSDLTARQINAEEAITHAGYFRTSQIARYCWNHCPDQAMEQVVRANERRAAVARAHPQRFVIPAGEPLPVDELWAGDHQLAQAALDNALLAAQWDEERGRREVD
jgi:hypothetical protein